jgi:SAM-dependent methyltransferase
MSADIASRSLKIYDNLLVAAQYAEATELQLPEMQILSRLGPEFRGKRILDIGVGGGRTTPHLLAISHSYTGIDYSPEMIEQCRVRYPGVDFRVCDVRDLSQFDERSFDLVFFSFNGIDTIGPSDRISSLAEIRRLLSEGGVFVFSSHNRASPTVPAWSPVHLPLRINPIRKPRRFVGRLLRYGLGLRNAWINKRYEEKTEVYELRNDVAFNYSLINYYIYIADQLRQLEDQGYRQCQAVGLDGTWLEQSHYGNRQDAWIYYVARTGA